jgi:16S rRNA A1518/A1519 N6-dimethyltransferase RsmA/KsgA/DIM1 with predicted DNA glycosylase/AP lyase activity
LIGVELDPHLCRHARQRAAEIKSDSVSEFTVYEQDMFTVDLERLGATVLILYLLPAGLGKLAPQLSQWLHNNKAEAALKHYKLTDEVLRRVVTINYQIPGWPVSERIVVSKNVINLYRP